MRVKRCDVVTITSDASGDGTGYTVPINGQIDTIVYTKTDYADTVDFTITLETSELAVMTNADATTSEVFRPRLVNTDSVGAAGTTLVPVSVDNERIKIVAAQAGNTKSGAFTVTIIGT